MSKSISMLERVSKSLRRALYLPVAALLLTGVMRTGAQVQPIPGIPGAPAGGAVRPTGGTRNVPARPVFNDRNVTLHSRGDLRVAIDALLTPSPVNYMYALRVLPTVTAPLDLKDVPFDQALSAVLKAYPAIPPVRAHLAGSVLSLVQDDPPGQKPDVAARRVTLRLKNIPLQDAFHALFAALGTDFMLDSTLSGQITFAGRDLTPSQAVAAMTKQYPGPLQVVQRANIIIIRRKAK